MSSTYNRIFPPGLSKRQRNDIRTALVRQYLEESGSQVCEITASDIVRYFNLEPREACTISMVLRHAAESSQIKRRTGIEVSACKNRDRYVFTISQIAEV